MTIKEFYEWAKENNVSDYTMKIQFHDDSGGFYWNDEEVHCWIYKEEKEVIIG